MSADESNWTTWNTSTAGTPSTETSWRSYAPQQPTSALSGSITVPGSASRSRLCSVEKSGLLANGIPDECECAACKGDVSGDNRIDGEDVQSFVAVYLAGGYHACADMDSDGTLAAADGSAFVGALLSAGGPCP